MILYAPFSELVGQTLASVTETPEGGLVFITDTGQRYEMYHEQNCCEHVYLEEIVGDLADSIGAPIVHAEEVISYPEEPPVDSNDLSHCWTFYKLSTSRGYITFRWYGASNGYYSETVSFFKEVPNGN